MKFALKTIVAATAFAAVGLASAANVTVQAGSVYNGLSFSGSGTLSFSQELLDALNTGASRWPLMAAQQPRPKGRLARIRRLVPQRRFLR